MPGVARRAKTGLLNIMAQLPIDFCRKVARTRRAKGMTQSALARSAGCAQSAISMFEGGHPEKLSIEFVRKVAEILEIPLENEMSEPAAEREENLFSKKGYCPNAACLSNIPYEINGELILWPTVSTFNEDSRYCRICGEVLELRCPQCGRDATPGAFCERCGTARITAVVPPGISRSAWVDQRRAEIREFRGLNACQ